MASDPNSETANDSVIPQFDFMSIKPDGKDLVRRVGQRSLQATVYWCIGSVLCLFANRYFAIAVLFGAFFQLRANYKWLAKTKVLTEEECRKWRGRLGWLTALVLLVALVHVASIVMVVAILNGSGGR